MPELRSEDLGAALRVAYPELDAVRAALEEDPVYLVGGAVRDLLLGRERGDIDLVVVGNAAALAARLGAEPIEHERFATAKTRLDGHEIDIARAREETYPEPGALPEVVPATEIERDLGRRDFTINAIALPLADEPAPIDPHGGRADLAAGLLRVLHDDSFVDDPTRAVRAARYAARFGFALESRSEELLRATDLGTVSADRRRAELLRLAAEPGAPRGFELLAEWGLVGLRPDGISLAGRVAALLTELPWRDTAPLAETVLAAALGPEGREGELAAARPERPSRGVELANAADAGELVLGRALGGEWLDHYMREWRRVSLEIDGDDLIAAGVPQGHAIGRGLKQALRRRLDGEIEGREQELEAALTAARAVGDE